MEDGVLLVIEIAVPYSIDSLHSGVFSTEIQIRLENVLYTYI